MTNLNERDAQILSHSTEMMAHFDNSVSERYVQQRRHVEVASYYQRQMGRRFEAHYFGMTLITIPKWQLPKSMNLNPISHQKNYP